MVLQKRGAALPETFEIKDRINQQAKRRFTYDFFLYARLYFSTQCDSFFCRLLFFFLFFSFFAIDFLFWFALVLSIFNQRQAFWVKDFDISTITFLQIGILRISSLFCAKVRNCKSSRNLFFPRNLSPWLERLNSFQGWIHMEPRSYF